MYSSIWAAAETAAWVHWSYFAAYAHTYVSERTSTRTHDTSATDRARYKHTLCTRTVSRDFAYTWHPSAFQPILRDQTPSLFIELPPIREMREQIDYAHEFTVIRVWRSLSSPSRYPIISSLPAHPAARAVATIKKECPHCRLIRVTDARTFAFSVFPRDKSHWSMVAVAKKGPARESNYYETTYTRNDRNVLWRGNLTNGFLENLRKKISEICPRLL